MSEVKCVYDFAKALADVRDAERKRASRLALDLRLVHSPGDRCGCAWCEAMRRIAREIEEDR